MFKKIIAVSVVSSFILTSPGSGFYQAWAQGGKIKPSLPGRTALSLPTAGLILQNPGSAGGSKWIKGFSDNPEWTLAPTIGPMGAVPVSPAAAQVQNAADLSLALSGDLESGKASDAKVRMESGKIFDLHPLAFKDQLTAVTAVLRDLPTQAYPRKRMAVSRIRHALRDMKKDRLALPPQYLYAGRMHREVSLSPRMEVVLARIENLTERARQDAFGRPKQRFVELFFSRLSRMESKMLEPVRRWEKRNGIGRPTLVERLIRQGTKQFRAVKAAFSSLLGDQRGFARIGWSQDPKNLSQGHYAKAVELYDEGKYRAAAAEFSKAIELNPDMTKAYLYQGHCLAHRSVNDLDGAVQSLRAAVQAEPNSYEAHYYLSVVLYRKGQKEGDSRLLEESRQEEQRAQEISGKFFR